MTSLVRRRSELRLTRGAKLSITETNIDDLSGLEGLNYLPVWRVASTGKCLSKTSSTAVIQWRISAIVVDKSTNVSKEKRKQDFNCQ
jgi:hypothetical protein